MKKAPAPEGARHQTRSQYSAYAERKGIKHEELPNLRCEVKQIEFPRFHSDDNHSEPWRGKAIFRTLFSLTDGTHAGYERILDEKVQRSPDDKPNDKYVTKGSKTAGAATPIGYQPDDLASLKGEVIVCAGLADGYRLNEATGLPVICGVGEANIPGNVALLQKHYPALVPIAAVDNDKAGKLAGEKSGCTWTCPKSAKDWSDVYQQSGREAVLAEYQEGMTVPAKPELETREESDDERKAQSDLIVEFVLASNDLFHDENDVAYAQNMDSGEVWPLAGKAFRHWLTAAFYGQTKRQSGISPCVKQG